jgi:hypothetical protein
MKKGSGKTLVFTGKESSEALRTVGSQKKYLCVMCRRYLFPLTEL